jgi:hypothetical protein
MTIIFLGLTHSHFLGMTLNFSFIIFAPEANTLYTVFGFSRLASSAFSSAPMITASELM